MSLDPRALAELRALLGEQGVLTSDAALFVHEADAMTLERSRPDVVALPRSTDEVSAVVRWARAHDLAVTARGAGTGLAGGCTCEQGGVALSVNRMDGILSVDEERMFAWVQPGYVNLWLSQHLAPSGLTFAPDPASQQVSTIGGNAATNAGGPHCLKYGVTINHILGLTVVLADGSAVTLGGEACDAPGFDLASIVIGSEGTLAVITEVCVRIVPAAEAVKTMLFDFGTIAAACESVSQVIAEGIVPAAMEIMDQSTVALVEAWLRIGLPTDAAAVLLIEIDGPATALSAQAERIVAITHEHGVRSVRVAADDAERATLWRGRKSSFGAYGRTGNAFYVLDGVVPRTRLAEALVNVHEMAAARGLHAGSVSHAGDGNLHPHIMFDPHVPGQQADAHAVELEILRMCIRFGGTITGEHGVGIEKRPMMPELFAPEDLATMERARAAFDPGRMLNPGKILPGHAGPAGEPPHAPVAMAMANARDDVEGPWT
jgi:glycolate oxidase